MTIEYEAIAKALFVNYESLYDIDLDTGNYLCFYQSETYEKYKLEKQGSDFFGTIKVAVPRLIAPEDVDYVLAMLSKDALISGTKGGKYYSFVYRISRNGTYIYHKIRAKKETVGRTDHIYLGVRDIDYIVENERKHSEAISSLIQKEHNHMKAILAGSEGYLEINITQNKVLERMVNYSTEEEKPLSSVPHSKEMFEYSALAEWMLKNLIKTNKDTFKIITEREYLMEAFDRGESRVSLDFSLKTSKGSSQPCRQVFYLYRDSPSGDIMSFCVLYDLTEQQRKEKELAELEEKLKLSRIRNFTSQMQPHFLYNALGSIQEIVLEEPERASVLIGDFTTYLRGCIRSMSNDATIPFRQELDNINAYVNIEKMRFGDRLEVINKIDAEDFEVLPLSVQPIVENAIRHGIYQKGPAGGVVTISSYEMDGSWHIEVLDDGVGFDYEEYLRNLKDDAIDSTGLKSLMFRLKSILKAEVKIRSILGEGTLVTISIPKQRGGVEDENAHSG